MKTKNLSAMGVIEELDREVKKNLLSPSRHNVAFLLKAFRVMREIAIERDYRMGLSMEVPADMTPKKFHKEIKEHISKETDQEFEKRMKDAK